MSKKQKIKAGIIFAVLFVVFLVGSIVAGMLKTNTSEEGIQTVMRDAVLHETFKVNLFGIISQEIADTNGRAVIDDVAVRILDVSVISGLHRHGHFPDLCFDRQDLCDPEI